MSSTIPDQPAASAPTPTEKPPKIPFGTWLMSNLMPIAFTIGVIALVYIKLNVVDTAKVVFGLGLVIFIHELGHFAAAKWCGVYVKAFSIGFGKPIPGLSFKYGETDYKIGWIPLGGYVAMLGEPENAEEGDPEDHPRSLKHKSVGQRMLIISAGVIMNLILGFTCFLIVYTHGVEEKPPIVGHVDTGSPAWQAGLHSEVTFAKIGRNENPGFDDLRPIVMSTSQGEKVPFTAIRPGREPENLEIEPVREAEALFPIIGVGPSPQLKLIESKRKKIDPFVKDSPASGTAVPFEPGDKIVASTDITGEITTIPPDAADPMGKPSFFDHYRRLRDLRSKRMTIRVQRADGDNTADIEVAPAVTLTAGMRMQMGRITALRAGGQALSAECVSNPTEARGLKAGRNDQRGSGDKITAAMVRKGDKLLVFGNKADAKIPAGLESVAKTVLPFDPLRLPYDLEEWADDPETKDLTVYVTTLRDTGTREESLIWKMQWDRSTKYQREYLGSPNSPVAITALGLAYQVESVVEAVASGSPAAAAGMKDGDLITAIRAKAKPGTKEIKWQEIKPHQWGYVFSLLQNLESRTLQIKVASGSEIVEREIAFDPDPTWFQTERGLLYQLDTRINKAENLGQAATMGINRTIRLIRVIYQNLYSMAFGRVSPWTMSGPLTIADISYKIAGENIWQFVLFIGMININLAVVNFLPIPMLDGGHFIFLIYEKIRGKPAPESVQVIALYIGVAMVLGTMLFVLFLDVSRMFF